ncbi:hypothetical protein AVEN_192554-1 [Araneus ventricosus]|uniref:Uncharacterized protein n=1 Tax=Araneus ventricosus TaxID=182803 RepID=A0A4Y2FU31_ARAVE|nr:hypothetical protein AVEN_192554-1 [Araneus ventricosus]
MLAGSSLWHPSTHRCAFAYFISYIASTKYHVRLSLTSLVLGVGHRLISRSTSAANTSYFSPLLLLSVFNSVHKTGWGRTVSGIGLLERSDGPSTYQKVFLKNLPLILERRKAADWFSHDYSICSEFSFTTEFEK